jgi:hypothetical protein
MRHRPVLAAVAATLAAAGPLAASAPAAGPDLGTVGALNVDRLTYTTSVSGNRTTVAVRRSAAAEALRQSTIAGKWGIPLVTFNGEAGGLSHDGRLLVLGMATGLGRPLRSESGFVVVDTRTLKTLRTIELKGDFAYDALSPNGRILYLIEHFSTSDVLRYRVRAYDLKTGRLLPQVIVDRREPDEPMSGMPSARVSSTDGRKVFTLYVSQEHPFVHLLDTVSRTAFCIDLPSTTDMQAIEQATMRLTKAGTRLTILGFGIGQPTHVVDVKTLRVS